MAQGQCLGNLSKEEGRASRELEVTQRREERRMLKGAVEATILGIKNQVRLKAQLQKIQRVYIQMSLCARNTVAQKTVPMFGYF